MSIGPGVCAVHVCAHPNATQYGPDADERLEHEPVLPLHLSPARTLHLSPAPIAAATPHDSGRPPPTRQLSGSTAMRVILFTVALACLSSGIGHAAETAPLDK